MRIALITALLCSLLSACGQKGPLFIPNETPPQSQPQSQPQ